MNKKTCKTGKCGANKHDTPNKHPNGKGDKPRNVGRKFVRNYESIDWDNRKKKSLEQKPKKNLDKLDKS
tara:strand:- start:873 stop:1079 length:207 start_codon:yes stop_codon:yes gene_type:complete